MQSVRQNFVFFAWCTADETTSTRLSLAIINPKVLSCVDDHGEIRQSTLELDEEHGQFVHNHPRVRLGGSLHSLYSPHYFHSLHSLNSLHSFHTHHSFYLRTSGR